MGRRIQGFLDEYQALLDDPEALGREFDQQAKVVDRLEGKIGQAQAELGRLQAELAPEQRRLELLSTLLMIQEQASRDRMQESRDVVMQALGRSLNNRGPVGIRLELVDVMRARREGHWTPAELEEKLDERGVRTSRSNLQSTLAAMVDDEQLVKVRRGIYRLGDNLLEEVDRITHDAQTRAEAT